MLFWPSWSSQVASMIRRVRSSQHPSTRLDLPADGTLSSHPARAAAVHPTATAGGMIPGYPRRCEYARETEEEEGVGQQKHPGGDIGRAAAVNAVRPVVASEVKTDRHTTCGWRTAE